MYENENNFPRIITNKVKLDFISKQFRECVGYELNIDNPQTFNEKIQWLKVFYKDPLMTRCTDKLAVRKYLRKKIGVEYLVDLAGDEVYGSANDIDFGKLPNKFALKTTDGSGTNIICRDKMELNIQDAKNQLTNWLDKAHSHYYMSFEWAYRNIKPRIVCEKYIEAGGGGLKDYKVMCFNGEPRLVLVCSERDTGNIKTDWFDLDWRHLPFTRLFPNSEKSVPKPENLAEMIKLATFLSKDFPFVRVDFYEVNGKLKVGELTFYPGNGTERFEPVEWDKKIGDMLRLPAKTIALPFEINQRRINVRSILRNQLARMRHKRFVGIPRAAARKMKAVVKTAIDWTKLSSRTEHEKRFTGFR